jgi:hypothetical protein
MPLSRAGALGGKRVKPTGFASAGSGATFGRTVTIANNGAVRVSGMVMVARMT